jgi:ribosomal protein S12 methylthiotransferase
MAKQALRFYLQTLGCPKNLVDGHGMARLLQQLGYQPVDDPRQAKVLIVNTCGFIEDARQESLNELRELASRKRNGQVLIAAGCLSQRWGEALAQQVPAVDALLGTRRWSEIGPLVRQLLERRLTRVPESRGVPLARLGDPLLSDSLLLTAADHPLAARQGASAYLKIADGCSAPCAFCAIPLIKGPAVSRPVEAVVADAVELVGQGVKELVLIAQDTTAYGRDWGGRTGVALGRDALPGLVQAILDAAPDLRWLRLMYAYPGHVSLRLIEGMAADPRVCHYLDLPLQHAHPDTLRRMRRPSNVEHVERLIANLRATMPDVALRTTFIVGYPGETEREFEALSDFVAASRFDRVGVFVYSPEEGTPAAALPNAVPEEIKAERYDRLMALQQDISLESNQAQVGRILDVLVEGQGEGLSVGRSYRDAPEIDGLVLVPGDLPTGAMVPVRITGAMEYDLVGEVIGSETLPGHDQR